LFVENGGKVAHYSEKEMQYMWMSSRAPWNHLYESKRRYSWERASSIIKACASSWSHGSMSGYNQPTLAYLADNGYVWAHNIFCTSSPTLEQPSVFKLMQYLDLILKRASLSMWWREEIKFYTVMYWCLKHELMWASSPGESGIHLSPY
jgi:hypothetical protein